MKQTSILRAAVFLVSMGGTLSLALAAPPAAPMPSKPSAPQTAPQIILTTPTPPAKDSGPGESLPTLGNQHVNSVEAPHLPYNSKPPTSGPHLPNIARWGIYDQQIPNELQVHNLEDGGVMIQYDCKDCDDVVAKLEQLVKDYYKQAATDKAKERYKHVIVAPYSKMGTLIALTAWGKIDKLDRYDEARIKRFVEAYVGIDHHPTE